MCACVRARARAHVCVLYKDICQTRLMIKVMHFKNYFV